MISKLILGAGCFWGVEVLFEEMSGVKKVFQGMPAGIQKTLHTKKSVQVSQDTLKLLRLSMIIVK